MVTAIACHERRLELATDTGAMVRVSNDATARKRVFVVDECGVHTQQEGDAK